MTNRGFQIILRAGVALSLLFLFNSTALAQRGVGPYVIRSGDQVMTARLLKRQADTLWVLRTNKDGVEFEAGIPVSAITLIEMPRPKVFDLADQVVASNQVQQVWESVKKITDALKPFRDLPGVPADEAVYVLGRLSEKLDRPAEALKYYEELLGFSPPSSMANAARLRAGFCHARARNHEKALEYFNSVQVPEEEVDLLSETYFARGQANAALQRYPEAVMSYLYLVVFHPYVNSNEVRCLEEVLPCYVELKDWDALFKTIRILKADFAGTRAAKIAAEYEATYEKELSEEKEFQ